MQEVPRCSAGEDVHDRGEESDGQTEFDSRGATWARASMGGGKARGATTPATAAASTGASAAAAPVGQTKTGDRRDNIDDEQDGDHPAGHTRD